MNTSAWPHKHDVLKDIDADVLRAMFDTVYPPVPDLTTLLLNELENFRAAIVAGDLVWVDGSRSDLALTFMGHLEKVIKQATREMPQ